MPESPPPENRSNPFWTWIFRGTVLIVVVLMILIDLDTSVARERAQGARARLDANNLLASLDQYATEYGYHPEGAPAELLRKLRGENQRKIIFFESAAGSVNARGEFIDPWGQPYHIDQSDPSSPRVYSSGPNRIDEHGAKGTDDIVGETKTRRAQADVNNLAEVAERYAMAHGYLPAISPAGFPRAPRGGNKRRLAFIDPWGEPYHLDLSDPSNPRVYSSGPNRIDEHGAKGSDDIVGKSKSKPAKPAQLPTPES
jgi:hypothetical protein